MLYIVTMNEIERRVDKLIKKHRWFDMEISKEAIEQAKNGKKTFRLMDMKSKCPKLFEDFENE